MVGSGGVGVGREVGGEVSGEVSGRGKLRERVGKVEMKGYRDV